MEKAKTEKSKKWCILVTAEATEANSKHLGEKAKFIWAYKIWENKKGDNLPITSLEQLREMAKNSHWIFHKIRNPREMQRQISLSNCTNELGKWERKVEWVNIETLTEEDLNK